MSSQQQQSSNQAAKGSEKPKPSTNLNKNLRNRIRDLVLKYGPNFDPIEHDLTSDAALRRVETVKKRYALILLPLYMTNNTGSAEYIQKWGNPTSTSAAQHAASNGSTTQTTTPTASTTAPPTTTTAGAVNRDITSSQTTEGTQATPTTADPVKIKTASSQFMQATQTGAPANTQSPTNNAQGEDSQRSGLDDNFVPQFGDDDGPGNNQLSGSDDSAPDYGDNDPRVYNNNASKADRAAEFQAQDIHSRIVERTVLNNARSHRYAGRATVETALETVLRSHFGGLGGILTATEKRSHTFDMLQDDIRVELQRRDLLSMAPGEWFQVSIVRTIMTSHFPSGVLGSVRVADCEEMSYLAVCNDDQVKDDQRGSVPFYVDETMDAIVSVVNVGNSHWLTVRACLVARTIELYDSYVEEDSVDVAIRRSFLENRLATIFNHFLEISSPSWAATVGHWRCDWPTTYLQRNSDDCGAHASQNAIDLARNGKVQAYHDAAVLRRVFVNRIGELLDNDLTWGSEDPHAAELADAWSKHANGGQQNEAGQSLPSYQSGRMFDDAIRAASENRIAFDPELANLSGSIPFPKFVPVRDAIVAILGYARPRKLTWPGVENQYEKMCMYLGVPLTSCWRSHMRAACTKRINTVVYEDEETGELSLVDPNATTSPMARLFYGREAWQHFTRAQQFRDDIQTRPVLIVVPERYSSVNSGNNAKYVGNAAEDLQRAAQRDIDYYLAVHGGTTKRPVQIAASGDMDFEAESKYWYYPYPIVRSSASRVFEMDNGGRSHEDENMLDILHTLDSMAERTGIRYLVTFLITGADGWFTNQDSFSIIANECPNLDLRITMLMQTKRVKDLPHVFVPRRHNYETSAKYAWAHFDPRAIAQIAATLQEDPRHMIQHLQPDQAAILFMFQEVERAKLVHQTRGDNDDVEVEDNHPFGNTLISGLHRHNLGYTAVVKNCSQCFGQAVDQWYRGPNDQADVVCEGCHEAIIERKRAASDDLEPPATAKKAKELQKLALDEKKRLTRMYLEQGKNNFSQIAKDVGWRRESMTQYARSLGYISGPTGIVTCQAPQTSQTPQTPQQPPPTKAPKELEADERKRQTKMYLEQGEKNFAQISKAVGWNKTSLSKYAETLGYTSNRGRVTKAGAPPPPSQPQWSKEPPEVSELDQYKKCSRCEFWKPNDHFDRVVRVGRDKPTKMCAHCRNRPEPVSATATLDET